MKMLWLLWPVGWAVLGFILGAPLRYLFLTVAALPWILVIQMRVAMFGYKNAPTQRSDDVVEWIVHLLCVGLLGLSVLFAFGRSPSLQWVWYLLFAVLIGWSQIGGPKSKHQRQEARRWKAQRPGSAGPLASAWRRSRMVEQRRDRVR